VILAARRETELGVAAAAIRAAGGRCSTAILDVRNSASIEVLTASIERIDAAPRGQR
jgi:NADP-dependent 3-hydroxy acid dehydrogenase YdfG